MALRVATWNINSITARLPRLLAWLEGNDTDVLCLQELKCGLDAFPDEPLRALGYEAAVHGTGRWNGVAVLSRIGLADVRRGLPDEPGFPDAEPEARAVAATCGPVRLWSIYAPHGREVGHPQYAYKLRWFEALNAAVAGDAVDERPFAVLGDFNIAPSDEDVWDPSVFEGATHVSPDERAALGELRGRGLAEVMPRALKYDRPYTFWDYRQLGFPRNRGMRIDLVLGNGPFIGAVSDAYVDREARKGQGASDHAPVVVELDLAS